jgi:hypothetical protein
VAAGAAEVQRKLQRRFKAAIKNAFGQARLRKGDIYAILRVAYGAVRLWKRQGTAGEAKRLLMREAKATITRQSSYFLVLLRSALPALDPKRASKWAAAMELADQHDVPKRMFVAFVEAQGGIEGAAQMLSRLRARAAEGSLC